MQPGVGNEVQVGEEVAAWAPTTGTGDPFVDLVGFPGWVETVDAGRAPFIGRAFGLGLRVHPGGRPEAQEVAFFVRLRDI